MPVTVRGLRRAFHRIKETVSAYAKNGHDVAILEKKVQNSLSVIACNHEKRKGVSENGHKEASRSKNIQNQVTLLEKMQTPMPRMDMM